VTYSKATGFSSPYTILTSDSNTVRWVAGVDNKIVWMYYNPSDSLYYICAGNIPPIGIAEDARKPYNVSLLPNFPNPFNSHTSICYTVSKSERIKLSIYNIQGQLVKTLEDGVKEAGNHKLIWDAKDNNGIKVNSGIYFYQLKTSRGIEAVSKMLFLRH
jgi:hypothetical protein